MKYTLTPEIMRAIFKTYPAGGKMLILNYVNINVFIESDVCQLSQNCMK